MAAESLERARATGANAIALIPTWYQPSADATTIAPDPDQTPTDESIAVIVRRAQALGLKVFLRPVVDDVGSIPRLEFKPTSPSAWFASYRAFIYHYANLAEALGVDMMSVGHEFHQLDGRGFTADWLRVIAGVRRRYHGPLTYGANNSDAWTHIGFWRALDVIGIDAYFPLSTGGAPGVARLVRHWRTFADRSGVTHHYLGEMRDLSARLHKRIVFTEVGYPSTTEGLVQPWTPTGSYASEPQRRGFEALFRALGRACWFAGVYIWDWRTDPAAGGPGNTNYTSQGKPAEATIRRWFQSRPPVARKRSRRARAAERCVR
jgi:hypothetical protein